MPCDRYDLGNGGVAIVCSRGRREPCSVAGCRATSVALCDYPLQGKKAGKTCDRRLCAAHRVSKGKDRDYCPTHEALDVLEKRREETG
jgi:hypothetical protein